eukprot:1176075-Prorocentrum_minimum.AAC.5
MGHKTNNRRRLVRRGCRGPFVSVRRGLVMWLGGRGRVVHRRVVTCRLYMTGSSGRLKSSTAALHPESTVESNQRRRINGRDKSAPANQRSRQISAGESTVETDQRRRINGRDKSAPANQRSRQISAGESTVETNQRRRRGAWWLIAGPIPIETERTNAHNTINNRMGTCAAGPYIALANNTP